MLFIEMPFHDVRDGLAIIAWVIFFNGAVWAWIGVLPLATGPFKFCPTYRLLGVNTCDLKK